MKLPQRVVPVSVHSPLDPTTARARLTALDERAEGLLASRKKIRAKLEGDQLYLHRDGGRNLIAEVHATLTHSDTGVVVEGRASVHLLTWLLPPVVALGVLPVLAIVIVSGELPAGMQLSLGLGGLTSTGVVGLLMWSALRNRAHVVWRLEEALRP